MNRSLFLLILGSALTLFAITRASAQYHFTSHSFNDTCGGGVFGYIDANIAMRDSTCRIAIAYGDGTSDTSTYSSSSSSIMGYNPTHFYTIPGTYTIAGTLLNSTGTLDTFITTLHVDDCTVLYDYFYQDMNGNCVIDPGEPLISYPCQVRVDSDGVAIDTIQTYGSMFFKKYYTTTTTYTFTPISTPPNLTVSCPSSGSISVTSTFGFHGAIGNFGFVCSSGSTSSYDIKIHSVSCAGEKYMKNWFCISSNSCIPHDGTLTIHIDSSYYIRSYSGFPIYMSNHTIVWNFHNLSVANPICYSTFDTTNNGIPLAIGTPATIHAYIDHLPGDTSITNDTAIIIDTVASSWDPNVKSVFPKGNISPGTTLTYTLAFENTGNAPALNIHILDTLSDFLDPNTIQIITSTHPVQLYSYYVGHTILNFDFPNINLPDTTHHGQADGYVMFSISSKNRLTNGTQINNRAGIYFDDNEVVMTNTVTNIIHSLGIANVNGISPVSVYPNPVENDLYIKTKGVYQHLTIINNLGQVVLQQELHNNDSHINVKTLQPGMYYIMLKGNSGVKVEKIEKL